MIVVFESILPVFLLVLIGVALRRAPVVDGSVWPGIEQLTYWILYPALLFVTILNADFSGLQLDAILAALLGSVAVMTLLITLLWPVMRTRGLVRHGQYSSVFQTTLRWNGFMALAIAQELFLIEGSAIVALAMAVIIIPLNVMSVYVTTRFANAEANWPRILRSMATNPLIVAVALALLWRASPVGLYQPLNEMLQMIGSAALGIGLLAIGAGLRPGDLTSLSPAIWIPVILKLAVFPVVMIALALLFGITGPALSYLTLCAAVPTAMNGYLLARQLGGDADLYAAVTTLQTGLAFLSIPAALALAAQFSSG